jgi:hypothetical protein
MQREGVVGLLGGEGGILLLLLFGGVEIGCNNNSI